MNCIPPDDEHSVVFHTLHCPRPCNDHHFMLMNTTAADVFNHI